MKLPIPCFACTFAEGADPSSGNFATAEFRDNGRYETVCSKGHKSVTILQQQKFELLFDIGAYAITDGYYREAVSSFTSSLERFYEFFIRASLFEKDVSEEIIAEGWKEISRQSERQLGAFVFLYLADFGNVPATLDQKNIQFRNDVIHRGTIPSPEQAMKYGQTILDLIRPDMYAAKEKYSNGVQAVIMRHIRDTGGEAKERRGTMTIPTIISLNRGDGRDERPLDQAIREMRRWDR